MSVIYVVLLCFGLKTLGYDLLIISYQINLSKSLHGNIMNFFSIPGHKMFPILAYLVWGWFIFKLLLFALSLIIELCKIKFNDLIGSWALSGPVIYHASVFKQFLYYFMLWKNITFKGIWLANTT